MLTVGNTVAVLVPVTGSPTEITDVFICLSHHWAHLQISLHLSLLQSYGSYQIYSWILLFMQ